ncbi:hypothetical protein PAHAL_8G224900 [Panicum hallii]|jgi:hypothetical protein|uniref:Uncharacterized protein n=1 Tax=Panicum hallii TaxID=206008 RepID=A0A2T8I9X0_9POAL|nr:hypothetical protein PAHAL_8G224900 [Panicum hallii]
MLQISNTCFFQKKVVFFPRDEHHLFRNGAGHPHISIQLKRSKWLPRTRPRLQPPRLGPRPPSIPAPGRRRPDRHCAPAASARSGAPPRAPDPATPAPSGSGAGRQLGAPEAVPARWRWWWWRRRGGLRGRGHGAVAAVHGLQAYSTSRRPRPRVGSGQGASARRPRTSFSTRTSRPSSPTSASRSSARRAVTCRWPRP